MNITDITSWAALLVSLVTIYIAWKKLKPETLNSDADAASKYEVLVDRAADREIKSQARWEQREKEYQAQIDRLMERMKLLETKQSELEEELRIAKMNSKRFEDWATRLAYQVQSMGGAPVKIGTGPLGNK